MNSNQLITVFTGWSNEPYYGPDLNAIYTSLTILLITKDLDLDLDAMMDLQITSCTGHNHILKYIILSEDNS